MPAGITRIWTWQAVRGGSVVASLYALEAPDGTAPRVIACATSEFCTDEVPEGRFERDGQTTVVTIPRHRLDGLRQNVAWGASLTSRANPSGHEGWTDFVPGSSLSHQIDWHVG